MRRIREALETHNWADSSTADDDDGLSNGLEEELLRVGEGGTGFHLEVNELEREMVGLRMAIEHGDSDGSDHGEDENGELQVESLEALMLRMKSLRGIVAPLFERVHYSFLLTSVGQI